MWIRFGFVLIVLAAVLGCDGANAAPKNAYRPPDPPAAPVAHQGAWSKQDKVEAVQRSGMSAEQKKNAIDQVNAGKL